MRKRRIAAVDQVRGVSFRASPQNKFPKWWQRPGTLARRGGRPIPLGLGLLTQHSQRSKKGVGLLLPTCAPAFPKPFRWKCNLCVIRRRAQAKAMRSLIL
jgi:hypothetical protein